MLMSDQIRLRYLFEQLNLNSRQARWLATINKFYFEIKYIERKENRVENSLSRWVEVNHLQDMSSFGTNLQDRLLRVGQQDVRYMEIMHRLQQSTSIGIGIADGTSIGIGIGSGIGTCDGICTSSGIGTGADAQDLDYFLAIDGLFKF